MGLIAAIAAVFIALLLLPFVVALLSLRKSRDASLYVKSDNVRDPRYFSNSFRALIEKGLDPHSRTVRMSRLEPFVYAEEVTGTVCDTIVLAEHPFRPAGVTSFHKEILAFTSAVIPPNTSLRAIACLDALELGENCEVVRWADSEKQMTALAGCLLGMSATSAQRLLIAPRCDFRRLYAPEIAIGHEAAETVRFPVDAALFDERLQNPGEIKPGETVRKTIVTDCSLEIGEGAVIMGSIKSSRHIFIRRNVRVNGNVVADGAIILDEGVRVLGNVFSQDSILVGPLAEIGVKPKIKSLIARKSITLCETCKVFGYIGCEVNSQTIARQDFRAELGRKQWASKMEPVKAEIAGERSGGAVKATSPPARSAAGEAREETKREEAGPEEEETLFD